MIGLPPSTEGVVHVTVMRVLSMSLTVGASGGPGTSGKENIIVMHENSNYNFTHYRLNFIKRKYQVVFSECLLELKIETKTYHMVSLLSQVQMAH